MGYPQQKENVFECPLNRDYNESRVERADYNSTPSTTLHKFSHCRQLKRYFIAAASYCGLFYNSQKSQNGYNFRTREVGMEWYLFSDLEDLGLANPLSENKVANVNPSLADSTSH